MYIIIICLGIILCLLIAFYITKRLYTVYLRDRLKTIRQKYPYASGMHKLPSTYYEVNREQKALLKRDLCIWETEEQNRINDLISRLQERYPNGWDICKKKYPNYSHSEMLSIEKEIISGERENTQTIIKKAKEDLHTLSKATQTGYIELAEKTIKKLDNAANDSTLKDVELLSAIKRAKDEHIQKYCEGISDTFEISYVEYTPPLQFVQGEQWHYPVAKFPSKGTVVFPYRRRKISRRGYMESTFQSHLSNTLSKYKLLIIGDCAILPADNYRPYEPDIAIIDNEYPAIRIDIEIDEPYSAISNETIHYIGCGDDYRDSILNNLGWIVVRFTEYQVTYYEEKCISFIAQLIYALNSSKQIPENLLEHPFPSPQNRWTEIEAKIMITEKVREKYLNHQFNAKEDEKIESSDITQTEKERACSKLVKPLLVAPIPQPVNPYVDDLSICERDKYIQFLPKEHIYIYKGHKQLTPVSNVISCHFEPFNAFYWSKIKADQRNVPQGQILEEWDVNGTRSREVGTFMHLQIGNYYAGLSYQQTYRFDYKGKYVKIVNELISLTDEYSKFMEFIRYHTFKPFRTEWTVYDTELGIAGTIDMIHKIGRDTFDIYDWKRSDRIVDSMGNPITIHPYGQKGLGALCHVDDTPYWHYCIQQNLYRHILEKNYGIKIGNMYLIIFSQNRNAYTKLRVPMMDETITAIVKVCKNGIIKQ